MQYSLLSGFITLLSEENLYAVLSCNCTKSIAKIGIGNDQHIENLSLAYMHD